MIEITLTRGKIALVDETDFELVSSVQWAFDPGTRSRNGYAKGQIGKGRKDRKTVYMHRLIIGAKRGELVDHINRNSLDNRRCNLRFATPTQSSSNIEHALAKHGFRGVHINNKAFRAQIQANGKRYNGPNRKSPLLAAQDYDRLCLDLHGEFAVTNFPIEEVM
jgi:hypothetical protein